MACACFADSTHGKASVQPACVFLYALSEKYCAHKGLVEYTKRMPGHLANAGKGRSMG